MADDPVDDLRFFDRREMWREEYNECRPHSSLGGLTPQQFADKFGSMRKTIAKLEILGFHLKLWLNGLKKRTHNNKMYWIEPPLLLGSFDSDLVRLEDSAR